MTSVPRISETEWEVMKIVWAHAPLTSAALIEHLTAQDPTWHPKTARTLINRLVKKRALRYRQQGRAYVYQPRVTEEECVAAVSASFLDRVFGGSLQPMLAHFVEHGKLTPAEIRDLQRLLERKA